MKKNLFSHSQDQCFLIFLLVTMPVVLCAVLINHPVMFFMFNFLAGVLAWTYLEYHMHRFWTHSKRSNSNQVAFQRHKHHHKNPTEIKVTNVQRLALLWLSAALFAASVLWNNYFTMFAGFAIGFSYSFFSHWILHQPWAKKLFPRLHQFHIHHHCKYPNKCFGFSTIFWDLVFKTTPPKNAAISERIIQFYYGQHQDKKLNQYLQ
ncbi:MAG TPA: sterol desaturase family protein [Chitinophagaceae bacterium]|nr:sterol desaturase family protein [Chitinophagaceae bacterium]